jgi:hypothetical protein
VPVRVVCPVAGANGCSNEGQPTKDSGPYLDVYKWLALSMTTKKLILTSFRVQETSGCEKSKRDDVKSGYENWVGNVRIGAVESSERSYHRAAAESLLRSVCG